MITESNRLNSKKLILLLLIFSLSSSLFGKESMDFFEEGKNFLTSDQPDKAVSALYAASKDPNTNPSVYLYLGIAYFRIGKYSEAINHLNNGQRKDIINNYLYPYNRGNIYFLQNRFDVAEKEYDEAISLNAFFAPAFLNRANARIKMNKKDGALQDYKTYLNLEPKPIQKDSINKMISLLESEAATIEREKLLTEARRIAEEAERLAAEERYKQLMQDVNSDLSSVDDADSVSAGADDTIDYSEEDELE